MPSDPAELLDRFGLITEENLAALLGIGVLALGNRPRSKLPEFVKTGRRKLFKEASVRELLGIEGPLLPEKRSSTCFGPVSYAPRGMSRAEAARYIGVHASTFDALVHQGRMPKPVQVGRHEVWDRIKLDAAFSLL